MHQQKLLQALLDSTFKIKVYVTVLAIFSSLVSALQTFHLGKLK